MGVTHGNEINVLLVDDRPDGLLALEAVLGKSQYRLFTASSGREALSQVFDREFAVIILDVQMPGMDGFEATRRIRDAKLSSGLARTPVVALTAHAMAGYREQCLQAGMDDYLGKPFPSVALDEILGRWITGT